MATKSSQYVNITPDLKPFKGLTGLKNLGNTCYMNAAVQCLHKIKLLNKYFRKNLLIEDSERQNQSIELLYQFQLLIKYLSLQQPVISPDFFVTNAYNLCPEYRPKTQQDSQEFLRLLLDSLDSSLKQLTNTSIISDIFKGLIDCKMTCHNCKSTSVRQEELLDISLYIPQSTELENDSSALLDYRDRYYFDQNSTSYWNSFKSLL